MNVGGPERRPFIYLHLKSVDTIMRMYHYLNSV